MKRGISYRALINVARLMEEEELVTLCIKYGVCIYCGGDLEDRPTSPKVRGTRVECVDCEEEFFRSKE